MEVLGNVYFATVYSFDDLVPDYKEAKNAVLLIQMRGRASIDETIIKYVEEFAPELGAFGNQLMLCGVNEAVLERLKVTDAYQAIGEENIFPTQTIVGASFEEAWSAAEKWIEAQQITD